MKYEHLNASVKPLSDDTEPTAHYIPEPETIVVGERIPCKKCGKSHGMGIKDMETGIHTPIDTCYDCMIFGKYVPIAEQVKFDWVKEHDEKRGNWE